MSIDRLTPTAALIAGLRTQLLRKEGAAASRGSAAATSGGEKPKSRDINVLRRELSEILKDVATEDVEAMNAVRPRVIKAVLLWEFGPELREHREWQPMLDRLVDTLEHDERHRLEFARMIKELRV